MAAGIALSLAALAGFLFLGQLRNYRDLDAQARIQTQAKIASQGMARDLSNAGAVLDDKRLHFVMRPDLAQVAWIDLKGRYCRTSDTVTTSYSVSRGPSGDTLLQTVRCNRRAATRRPVVIGLGSIGLAFTYFDRDGLPTAIPAAVRQVEFALEGGYAIAAALLFMMVLVMVGSVSLLKVRGELRHTTRDILQTRAQAVAESAVNWALSGLSLDRPGGLAYRAATHANDGVQPLPDYLQNNEVNPRKLHSWDVAGPYGGAAGIDREGWIFQRTVSPAASLTRSREEIISFRVWFPDDSTVRVTGRGEVQGVQAQVERTGRLVYRAIGSGTLPIRNICDTLRGPACAACAEIGVCQ